MKFKAIQGEGNHQKQKSIHIKLKNFLNTGEQFVPVNKQLIQQTCSTHKL